MAIGSIRVTENYPLTIPKEIRNEILIEAGDEIDMMVNEKKEVIICKVKKGPVEDGFGIWTGTGEKVGLIM